MTGCEPPRLCVFQYGRSDSYRVATTQDKDDKESPKKKGGKDLDDLKKEVPIVRILLPASRLRWSFLFCVSVNPN